MNIRLGSPFTVNSNYVIPTVLHVALQNLSPVFLLSFVTVKSQNFFIDFSTNTKMLQLVCNNLEDPFKINLSFCTSVISTKSIYSNFSLSSFFIRLTFPFLFFSSTCFYACSSIL